MAADADMDGADFMVDAGAVEAAAGAADAKRTDAMHLTAQSAVEVAEKGVATPTSRGSIV